MSNQKPYPLQIDNLKKSFASANGGPRIEAVKGVSFHVNPGEIFGLLGPNGAGKTTIISIITTLESCSSGTAKVFGTDTCFNPMEAKRNMGVVHQEVITSGFFDVEEILNFQSGYYGIRKNTERIHFLLEKLGLFEHRHKKVKQLSGGMKRRLMIAKALVHSPRLLLLDEPTAGVDISLRETLWDFVSELRTEGLSILLTTHYLEEAERLCDRVGIINHGQLEFLGSTQDIVAQFTQRVVSLSLNRELPAASPSPHSLSISPHASAVSPLLLDQKGTQYRFSLPQTMTVGNLMSQLNVSAEMIEDIRIQEGSLEDAFLSVLRKKSSNAEVRV